MWHALDITAAVGPAIVGTIDVGSTISTASCISGNTTYANITGTCTTSDMSSTGISGMDTFIGIVTRAVMGIRTAISTATRMLTNMGTFTRTSTGINTTCYMRSRNVRGIARGRRIIPIRLTRQHVTREPQATIAGIPMQQDIQRMPAIIAAGVREADIQLLQTS